MIDATISISVHGAETTDFHVQNAVHATASRALNMAAASARLSAFSALLDSLASDEIKSEERVNLTVEYFKSRNLEFSDNVQPVFPKAYRALANVPSLFDTLMDLERMYSLAISSHLEETRVLRLQLLEKLDVNQSSQGEDRFEQQKIFEFREELMIFDATRESLLGELRNSQKSEYRDFVVKACCVHNELLVLSNQQPVNSETIPLKIHAENTHAIANSFQKLVNEGDKMLEGAVIKLRRAPSQSMMAVGSLEGFLSGKNNGSQTPKTQDEEIATTNAVKSIPEQPSVSIDPELDNLINEIKEMGFTNDQATAALDLSKRNLQEAIITLLESPERVDRQIRDAATRKMLFSTSNRQQINRSISGGTSQQNLSKRPSSANLRRSNSNTFVKDKLNTTAARYPSNSPLAKKQTESSASSSNPAVSNSAAISSPLAFFQQKQAKISADIAAMAATAIGQSSLVESPIVSTNTPSMQLSNIQKGFTNFLGKAMGALNIDPASVSNEQNSKNETNSQINDDEEMSESFTTYFGTQVRTMYSLRFSIVPQLSDAIFAHDREHEQALRAQTSIGLYSNDLSGCILLVRASELHGYGLGKSANREFIKRCKQVTEFHFDDIEIQLQKALNMCPLNDYGIPIVKEGDFFITKHSNLPQVHVLFHLIVPDDNPELTSQSKVMIGYRNILKLSHARSINNLIVPLLFLPDQRNAVFPSSQLHQNEKPELSLFESNSDVVKRAEMILKCTRGVIIEQTRALKHAGDSSGVDKRGRSLQFVFTRKSEQQIVMQELFQEICGKFAEVFKAL
ncbi:hypothetical protein HK100_005092, partial [Physocladia obscura]